MTGPDKDLERRIADLEQLVARLSPPQEAEELRIRAAGCSSETVIRHNGLVVFQNAQPRIGLYLGDQGPRLTLYDAEGKPQVGLDAVSDTAGLRLYDGKGNDRLVLQVAKDSPGLYVQDADGTRRIEVQCGAAAELSINDGSGGLKILLSVDNEGVPVVSIPRA